VIPGRNSLDVWEEWKYRRDEGRYGRPDADAFEQSRLRTTHELWQAFEDRGAAYPRGDLSNELFSAQPDDYPHHSGGVFVLFPLVTRAGADPRSQSLGDYILRGDCVVEHPAPYPYHLRGSLRRVGRNQGMVPAHIRVQAGVGFLEIGAAALQEMGITAPYFNCQLRWLCRFCGHEDESTQRNWTSDDPLLTNQVHVYSVGHERRRAEAIMTRGHPLQSRDPPPQGEPNSTFIEACEFGDPRCSGHGPPESCGVCEFEHFEETLTTHCRNFCELPSCAYGGILLHGYAECGPCIRFPRCMESEDPHCIMNPWCSANPPRRHTRWSRRSRPDFDDDGGPGAGEGGPGRGPNGDR
jgi:hypothetical protein